MATTIHSEITIDAPPARVWSVLTDFNSYPEWSPFVREIEGELRPGARLTVRLAPSGGEGMVFKPVVTEVRESAVLEWLGHLLVAGIFDGRHRFTLTALKDGTTAFTQSETFGGILIPFMSSLLKDTERAFAAFNEALKARTEAA